MLVITKAGRRRCGSGCAALFFVAVAWAQTPATAPAPAPPPLELRYGTSAPRESVAGRQVGHWADAVERESRGAIKVQVFYGGQLGADAEIVQRVARGRIEMGGVSVAFLALLVPELQLLALPMFFRSASELECVLDRGLADVIIERLAARGVRFFGWGGTTTLDLVGKRPFSEPSDVAGVRAGTFGSRVGAMVWEALRANATPTTSVEIAGAFQTGLIDVAVVPLPHYVASGLARIAPVLSHAELMFMPTMHFMGQSTWERLEPEQRAALERARASAPAPDVRRQWRDFESELRRAHAAGGGRVVETTPEQRGAFRRLFVAAWPRMAQEAGPEGPRFFELLKAAQQACERSR